MYAHTRKNLIYNIIYNRVFTHKCEWITFLSFYKNRWVFGDKFLFLYNGGNELCVM